MTPTARSLAYLRKQGYLVDIYERWKGPVRKDLFGIFDLIAIGHYVVKQGIVGIQVTTGSNHAARRAKLLATASLQSWKLAGGGALILSWRQGKGKRWEPRLEWL
mgnify:CR=1 FL=1